MNTPVSYELAKLLKEKGFEKPCISCYNEYDSDRLHSFNSKININKITEKYAAPIISDVVMWLYEEHDIWCWVENYPSENTFIPQIPKAINLKRVLGFYNSPTEAYSEAILYCLNKLI